MIVPVPSREALERLAAREGRVVRDDELDALAVVIGGIAHALEAVVAFAENDDETRMSVRDAQVAPVLPSEDPLNALVRRCRVLGDGPGPLAGTRVAIKDNVSIAGVPLTCGSRLLGTHVPRRDAPIVTRILAAGADIVAVTNMDDLALSPRGDTSAFGPVLNPHDHTRLAGGSSGGSAAALSYDGVDLTIGGDQGGSIRIPASWCGVVGLKPTHGLVPYTGVVGIDPTIDHVGPMGRTVADVARLLDVIAGPDGVDPRQRDVRVDAYADALQARRAGRIGVLKEGFGLSGAEPEVEEAVRAAIRRLAGAGFTVTDVSVPWHGVAGGALVAILMEGFRALTAASGVGFHLDGRYDVELADAFAAGMRERATELPLTAKLTLLGGAAAGEGGAGRLYARVQNLRPRLRAAYDRVLADVDVLAMPTTPMRAQPYQPGLDALGRLTAGMHVVGNTAAFDATGHPAISVPCGMAGGLPVGLMLVGRHFQDATVLRVAAAVEASA